MPRGKPFGPDNPGRPFGPDNPGVPFEPGHERNLPVRFKEGNDASVKHGAGVAALKLASEPETLALEEAIWQAMPLRSPADAPTVALTALTLRRIQRAVAAIETADRVSAQNPLAAYLVEHRESLARLREDLRGWISLAARLTGSLGLNPSARAKLGLDVALARRTMSLLEYYGDGEPEGEELAG
jgi:hypothetical protein